MKAKTKTVLKRASILAMSAALTFTLFGCEQGGTAHEHVFSTAWSYDETSHWHEPVCSDVSPQKEPHFFLDGKCMVCEYTIKSPSQSPEENKDSEGSQGQNQGQGSGESQGESGEQTQGGQGSQSGQESQGNQGSQGGGETQEPSKPGPSEPDPSKPENPEPENPSKPENPIEPSEPEEGQGGEQGQGGTPQVDPDPSLDELYGNSFPTDDSSFTGEPNERGLVKYRIRINRSNGLKICWQEKYNNGAFLLHYPRVRVTNAEKKEVYNGVVPVWNGCLYGSGQLCLLDLELPKGTYTVEPLDLPKGFVYKKEYQISAEKPVLDLRLSSNLFKSDTEIEMIAEGYVLPDLKIKSINKGDTTLGALLKKYKIVIFSFFYSGCYWCMVECPTLVKIYQKYKDSFTFVLFDMADGPEVAMQTVRSPQWFGSIANDFYVVYDKENDNLYQNFGSKGVPANVFIDQGGYIFEIAGGLTETHFEEILYYNLTAKVT